MLEYNDNIGVDEAGRGPLLGCVVACCVYINKRDNKIFELVNDSKKLSEAKREYIYQQLINSSDISYGIGISDEKEIDEVNILNATFLAMNRALDNLYSKNKSLKDKLVIVDGNKLIKGYIGKQEFLVKGDSKNLSISIASIIAKVTRDKMMYEYDKMYSDYGIASHKGYGTKKHYEAIEKYGILPIHRKTFLKKFLNKD